MKSVLLSLVSVSLAIVACACDANRSQIAASEPNWGAQPVRVPHAPLEATPAPAPSPSPVLDDSAPETFEHFCERATGMNEDNPVRVTVEALQSSYLPRPTCHELAHELVLVTALTITSNAGKYKISDLSVLRTLPWLTSVQVINEAVRDLSPLAMLRSLTELRLGNNHIQDLRPLAGLTELRTLDLQMNWIEDLTPLARLPHLRELFLSDNHLMEVQALESLPEIQYITLTRNPIGDERIDELRAKLPARCKMRVERTI